MTNGECFQYILPIVRKKYVHGDILISAYQIKKYLKHISPLIAKRYKGKQMVMVGIMKGTFILLADLARHLLDAGLDDFSVSFITVQSYKSRTISGKLNIIQDIDINPKGRHILLVDDIIDTGRTLQAVHTLFKKRGAFSVCSFILLSKPERRTVSYEPDYHGFVIPNVWVQGYGMDTAEIGRGNKNIIIGPYHQT